MMRQHKRQSIFLLISIFSLLLGLLTGCGGPSSQEGASNKIMVVAAEDFYGEAVQAVGGKRVSVTSVINKPSMDPHDFEPTAATARAVSDAKLVVYNGVGYDGWMNNLVKQSKAQTTIRVAEDVMGKKDGDNEHLWYNPETMPKLTNAIAEQLSKIDEKHAAEYKHNAKKYIEELKPIQEKVAALNKHADHKKIDVSEPVFDYMVQALGYTIANNHFETAVEQESDPSPKDIAAMQQDIKEQRIAFFVSNIQEISPTVSKMMKLADQHDVPVVKVTETLPKGKNYKTWMLDQLSQVEAAQNRH